MKVGLGIDFGTSATKAALVVGGRIQLVLDQARAHISSAVHVPRQGALRVAPVDGVDPARTVTSIKRLLGRAHDDPRVRALDAGVGYDIVAAADGTAHVKVDGVEIAPVQVVAAVLRHVRELAEGMAGTSVESAVMSVPVHTCAGYAAALRRAAQLAGLPSVQLVHEPVAALWGSRIGGGGTPRRRVLVSDFGAGTHDCALLELRPDRVEVLASGGDDYLGGDDLDLALAERVAGDAYRAHRVDLHRDRLTWSRLVRASEAAKRQLSSAAAVRLSLERAFVLGGTARDVERDLGRGEVEELWRPFVERAIGAARDTLAAARIPADLIDDLVLVGGTSLVPLVRSTFVKRLGRQPAAVCASDVVIAAGLAMMVNAQLCRMPGASRPVEATYSS